MNRVIKFRAWDKINKRWLNVSSLSLAKDGTVNGVWELRDGENELYGLHQVDIVHFIGLLDKNGKEIYEGDIIKIDDFFYGVVYFWQGSHKVDRANSHYRLHERICYCSEAFSDSHKVDGHHLDAEIIGNIYENPELL